MVSQRRRARELAKHDKDLAAIHEAGHLTAALAAGIRARANLVRTGTHDAANERLFTGQTELQGTMSPTIALAGIVAECWEADRDISAGTIVDWIENGVIEPCGSDQHIAADNQSAIEEALDVLRMREAFFRWAVDAFQDDGVITDGMAWEAFHEGRVLRWGIAYVDPVTGTFDRWALFPYSIGDMPEMQAAINQYNARQSPWNPKPFVMVAMPMGDDGQPIDLECGLSHCVSIR